MGAYPSDNRVVEFRNASLPMQSATHHPKVAPTTTHVVSEMRALADIRKPPDTGRLGATILIGRYSISAGFVRRSQALRTDLSNIKLEELRGLY